MIEVLNHSWSWDMPTVRVAPRLSSLWCRCSTLVSCFDPSHSRILLCKNVSRGDNFTIYAS
jgi:hypothetical protein